MKVGVISDTHVPTAAAALPPAVFELFQGVDLILHAGDIVERSVLDELSVLAPVEAVAGNMDGADIQATLPHKKVMMLGKFKVGLIHGKYKVDVQREMIRKEFGEIDLIVYGHSHAPYWGIFDDVHFLNPGSPTDKRYAPYNSVAILDISEQLNAEIVRI